VTTGKMFDRTDRRPGLRVWLLRAFVTILLSLLFQWRVGRILPMSGDEPHYLLTSVSLLRAGDADLANNCREDEGREFGLLGFQPLEARGIRQSNRRPSVSGTRRATEGTLESNCAAVRAVSGKSLRAIYLRIHVVSGQKL
jgi:hypothetical protein